MEKEVSGRKNMNEDPGHRKYQCVHKKHSAQPHLVAQDRTGVVLYVRRFVLAPEWKVALKRMKLEFRKPFGSFLLLDSR